MERLNRDKVEVEVDDIKPFINDKYIGFKILWSGTVGFGEYTIYRAVDDDEWQGDSEYMDYSDDKWFLDKLYESFKKKLNIR